MFFGRKTRPKLLPASPPMPFQFMCPQGHLLEGHETQMGQQVQCPICGTLLIVPTVGPTAAPMGPPAYAPPEYQPPAAYAPPGYVPPMAAPEAFPDVGPPVFPAVQEPPPPAEEPVPPAEPAQEEPPQTVRILCPNGHELHTPMDMIGMQAACPECNAEFLLRYEDSLEYIEKKKAARQKRDEAFNQAALKWSIAAAVIVFLALVTMMIVASMR
jgi:hypothetical protein